MCTLPIFLFGLETLRVFSDSVSLSALAPVEVHKTHLRRVEKGITK